MSNMVAIPAEMLARIRSAFEACRTGDLNPVVNLVKELSSSSQTEIASDQALRLLLLALVCDLSSDRDYPGLAPLVTEYVTSSGGLCWGCFFPSA